ncbi:MAG TPA: subclass B3 metallo-beta-lactamase [Gemmatimonadaceae bacterium]|nr:subclass B3 metallo-beta-lactamase [Gemmatimonadaceae bacterium]
MAILPRLFRIGIDMLVRRALLALFLPLSIAGAQRARECPSCAEWNAPHRPFRLHGDTYFVGTHGLSAILITSPAGHVLIDAALPESAPLIRANIEALGFRVRDVKLIVNSHAHFDHAGGVAELQRASGARVLASAWSTEVMTRGKSVLGDPQYGTVLDYPAVRGVKAFDFGDTLRVGPIAIVPRATPGHTPGGTSWSWRSCEAGRCLDFVYADSQTPVSSDGFLYTKSAAYPGALADFERGHATLERLSCDVLITPHPTASSLWERVAQNGETPAKSLVDRDGCKRYAATARRALAQRVAQERGDRAP